MTPSLRCGSYGGWLDGEFAASTSLIQVCNPTLLFAYELFEATFGLVTVDIHEYRFQFTSIYVVVLLG